MDKITAKISLSLNVIREGLIVWGEDPLVERPLWNDPLGIGGIESSGGTRWVFWELVE